jgi:hypothetical protein
MILMTHNFELIFHFCAFSSSVWSENFMLQCVAGCGWVALRDGKGRNDCLLNKDEND